MLPRFPRCYFQRSVNLHLTKCSVAIVPVPSRREKNESRFSTFSDSASTKSKQNTPFRPFSQPPFKKSSQLISTSIGYSKRYKSTESKLKNQNEAEKIETQEDEKSGQTLVEKISPEIRPKIRHPSKSEGSVIVQKTEEEDEKSRRRYEKEDPHEEERHKYWKSRPDRSINKALMRTDFFDNMKGKTKENFQFAVELFTEHDRHLRGHVEFIYSALKLMKQFGVHRDLETYKKLIDVFPKGKMIPTNMFQAEFMHYPKQQQCAIDVLEQMEDYGVIPDSETEAMLKNVFGSWSIPMRKCARMLYWMPKFKNLSPWKLPDEMPDNALELAKLAVARMTSVDLTTKITVFNCEDLEDAYDMTWIVSGQSPEQQKLIEELPSDRPIYVEGAFRVWMKLTCMNYFILRADPRPKPPPSKADADPDDVSNIPTIYEDEFLDTAHAPSSTVHEQEDGVVLGICCTGSSSRDSVVSWIRFLEEANPRLGKDISVLFTLKSPVGPTDDLEILTFRDIEELQRLGKEKDPFLQESKTKDKLNLDPGMPDLRQVGIWTESETRFPNWPHNFHAEDSISMKNKLENEKILQEIEWKEADKKLEEIKDDEHEKKQIEK